MKNILLLSLIVLLGSCLHSKDLGNSNTYNYLVNQTSFLITIKSYSKGIERLIISLKPNESKEVFKQYSLGKDRGISLAFTTWLNDDSITVDYEDKARSTHYYKFTGSNPRAILIGSPRNLFNSNNYQYKLVDETKNTQINEYRYTFTEQDYLDAKK